VGREVAQFEIHLAQRLTESNSPVSVLDPRVEPRVYERDGFAMTLWTYYESIPREIAAPDYATALARLHAGMRVIDLPSPHFTDRVAEAQHLLGHRELTPDLDTDVRALLSETLRDMTNAIRERGTPEQLLHGEPHAGNVLNTKEGPRFIDLETCCRGPIEYDLAYAPAEVIAHYPNVDHELLRECWLLMRAMVITWRWDRTDQLPNGRWLADEWLTELRTELGRS
jgi:hypothetical protein